MTFASDFFKNETRNNLPVNQIEKINENGILLKSAGSKTEVWKGERYIVIERRPDSEILTLKFGIE